MLRVFPLAFLSSFFAVGLSFWRIPYNQVNLPNALLTLGLWVVGASASLLCFRGAASIWRIAVIIGAAVPAAVFARIVVKGIQDPTSHNLWPLEVLIAVPIGWFTALAGAVLGALAARLVGRSWGRKQT